MRLVADTTSGPIAAEVIFKEDMIHELDAVVAHLYGLSEPQIVHIFETFHEGWDYQERLEGVRRHFREWSSRPWPCVSM